MSNTEDWREDFYEVRVFASKPVEFTITVKANDESDALEEALKELNKITDEDIQALDQYDEGISLNFDDWDVIGIAESHGFENTLVDFKEAKRCAWNVEDKGEDV